jgi:hypothetical protein
LFRGGPKDGLIEAVRGDPHPPLVLLFHRPPPLLSYHILDPFAADLLLPEPARYNLVIESVHLPTRTVIYEYQPTEDEARQESLIELLNRRIAEEFAARVCLEGDSIAYPEAEPITMVSILERLNQAGIESSYTYGPDHTTFDARPDACWRCDAVEAATDVGLCNPCHSALKEV